MKTLLLAALLAAAPLTAQVQLGGHIVVPSSTDSNAGQANVVIATDADCNVLTSTNCTVSATDGVYRGTLVVTSSVALTATRNLLFVNSPGRWYVIENNTTGGQALTVAGQTGSGVSVANGARVLVVCDGTSVGYPSAPLVSLNSVTITNSTVDSSSIGSTTPSTGHFTTLKVDSLAGAANNVLSTVDAYGTMGPSNIYSLSASVPSTPITGFVTMTGDGMGHGTLGYTTGIYTLCPGASATCGIQQLNFAPTRGVDSSGNLLTKLTAAYNSGDTTMQVNTLANISPSGIGAMSRDGGAQMMYFSWTGTSYNSTTGVSTLTGVGNTGYWGSIPMGAGYTVPIGRGFLQVNIAYSYSVTSLPYYVVFQSGAIHYNENDNATNSVWTNMLDGVLNFAPVTGGSLAIDNTNFPTNTPKINTTGTSIHDALWLSNSNTGSCLAKFLFMNDVRWGNSEVDSSSSCSLATNGYLGTEALVLVQSTGPWSGLFGAPTLIHPQLRIGLTYAIWSVMNSMRALQGNSTVPAIAFGTGSGSIVSTSTNIAGTITSSTTGAVSFTLTWAASLAYANRAVCTFTDETTHSSFSNLILTTTANTTTLTAGGTTVSGDTISYSCVGY